MNNNEHFPSGFNPFDKDDLGDDPLFDSVKIGEKLQQPIEKIKDWEEYYKQAEGMPPQSLMIRSLVYVPHHNSALDLGSGNFRDTKHLLKIGFDHVDAVDATPESLKYLGNLKNNPKLNVVIEKFEQFQFPQEEYDLVNAEFSLPYVNPESFDEVFQNIKNSLKLGGIFCGQFFGPKDDYSNHKEITIHTEEEVRELFQDMKIIVMETREFDGKTIHAGTKHFNFFNIIAKKI